MGKTYRNKKTEWDDDYYQPPKKQKKKFTRRKEKNQEVTYEKRPENGVHNWERSVP
jgi:hypothetical protein